MTNPFDDPGTWHVRGVRGGRYALTLRERPAIAGFPLTATTAQLQVADHEKLMSEVPAGATGVRFEVDLEAGDTRIKTWLIEEDGISRGAYYTAPRHYLGKRRCRTRMHFSPRITRIDRITRIS